MRPLQVRTQPRELDDVHELQGSATAEGVCGDQPGAAEDEVNPTHGGTQYMQKLIAVLFALSLTTTAAQASDFGNPKGFGWQDRERLCVALTPEQCTVVLALQIGGGDGAAGAAGDGGAAAGAGAGDGGSGSGSGNGGCR